MLKALRRPGWLQSGLVTILGVALGLLTSIVLGRTLGPEGRGSLAAVTVWPAIIAAVACLSLNDATTILLARAGEREAADSSSSIIGTSFVLHIVMGMVAAGVCFIVMPILLGARRAVLAETASLYGACFSVLTMLAMFQKGVLLGQHRTQPINILRIVQPLLWLGALTTLTLTSALTWKSAAFASLFALLASVALGWAFVPSKPPPLSRRSAIQLIKQGGRFQSANIALYAAAEADKILVLGILGNTDVGIYLVAQSVSGLIFGLISQTLSVRMLSDVARANEGDRGERVRLYFNASALAAGVLGVGVIICAPIIPVIYSKAFQPAVSISQVLAVGFAFKGARSPIDQGLRASGYFHPGVITEASALATLSIGAYCFRHSITLLGFSLLFSLSQLIALLIICIIATKRYQMRLGYWLGVSDGQLTRLVRLAYNGVKGVSFT